MISARPYLGTPYRDRGRGDELGPDAPGLDCWGLVVAFYRREFGLELPSYAEAYASAEEAREVAAAINGGLSSWVRVATPEPGDVVRLWVREPDLATHVGIYLGGDSMLNVRAPLKRAPGRAPAAGHGAIVESIRVGFWSRHVVDFLRHRSRVAPSWRLHVLPAPHSLRSRTLEIPVGASIADALELAGLERARDGSVRVLLGDVAIPELAEWNGRPVEAFRFVKPRAGDQVVARSLPRDPVSLTAFLVAAGTTLGSIGSALAPAALTGAVGGAVGAGTFGLGIGAAFLIEGAAVFLTGVAFAGATFAATSALTGLASPSEAGQPTAIGPAKSAAAGGLGNELRPWEVMPAGIGRFRAAPPFGAPPFTELVAGKRYWRLLLVVGSGRYRLRDPVSMRPRIYVGETPIDELTGAAFEIREGGRVYGGPTSDPYRAEVIEVGPNNTRPFSYWPLADASGSSSAAPATGAVSLTRAGDAAFGAAPITAPLTGPRSRTACAFSGAGRLSAAVSVPDFTFETWIRPEDLATPGLRCILSAGRRGQSGVRVYHDGRDLVVEATQVQRSRFSVLAPILSSLERRYPGVLPAEGTSALVVLEAQSQTWNAYGDRRVRLAPSVNGVALAAIELGYETDDGDGLGGYSLADWLADNRGGARPVPGVGYQAGVGNPVRSRWSDTQNEWIGGHDEIPSARSSATYGPPAWASPSGVFAIGQEVATGDVWSRGFKGRLQHAALYPRFLPPEEERWHYDVGIGAVNLETEGAAPRGARYRIYGDSVYEKQINLELPAASADFPIGTASDWIADSVAGVTQATEHSVVLEFPLGLWRANENGKDRPSSVAIDVEYRPKGDGVPWRKAADAPGFGNVGGKLGFYREARAEAGGTVAVASGEVHEGFTTEIRWQSEPGDFLYRVRRIEREGPGNRGGSDTAAFGSGFNVLAFRAVEVGRPPLNVEGITTVALTLPLDTTGGSVDRIFVEGERLLRIYDPGDPEADPASGFTPYRVTSNAADAALAILTDPDFTPEPLEPEECDFDAFDALRATAEPFDLYVDFQSNVRDLANMVLAGSFAGLADDGDGRVSVIQDRPGLEPKGLVTPKNARNFRVTKHWPDLSHAVRVAFINGADGFNADQEIVYADGYGPTADPANGIEAATRFDAVTNRGTIDRSKVHAYYRKRQAANEFRTVEYACEMDLDALAWRRGDVVELTHPTALIGEKWGRIVDVERNAGGLVVAFLLDDFVRFAGPPALYGMRAWLEDGRMVGAAIVNPGAGDARRIELAAPFPLPIGDAADLEPGTQVAIGRQGLETLLAMVREIRPRAEDFAADLVFFPYAPQLHAAPDGPVDFEPPLTRPVSRPELAAPPRPSIRVVESDERFLMRTPAGLVTRARVHVIAPSSSRGAPVAVMVRARRIGAISGPWIVGAWADVGNAYAFVEGLADGARYEFEARTQARGGLTSEWSTGVVHVVQGKANPPPDVPELRLEGELLRWRYPSDQVPDLDGFEVRYRIGNQAPAAWQSATLAHSGLIRGSEFPVAELPRAWGLTVYVNAVDVVRNRSRNAAVLLLAQGGAPLANVLRRISEGEDGWPGTIEGGAVSGFEVVADLVGLTETGTATLGGGGLEVTVGGGLDLALVRDGDFFYFDADGVELASRIARRDVGAGELELVDAYEGAVTSGACTIEPSAWLADDREPAWNGDDGVDAWGPSSAALVYTARRFTPHPITDTGRRLTLEVVASPATAALDVEYRELGPWPAWGPDDAAPAWGPDDLAPAWVSTTSEAGDAEGWSPWRPWPGQLEPLRRAPHEFRARIREDRRGESALAAFNLLVDVEDRVAKIDDLVVGPEGVRVPLDVPFHEVKRVRVSVQTVPGFDATGYGIADKRADGPLIVPMPPGSRGLFDVEVEGF